MPGAWEIVRMRKNSVLVGILRPPEWQVSLGWAQSLRELATPPGSNFFEVRGSQYDSSRNQVLQGLMQGEWGWVFFMDSDLRVPGNVINRLMEPGVDLIGALYHKRYPPFPPAHGRLVPGPDGNHTLGPLPDHQAGQVVKVDFLASGATLISRRCVDAMFRRHYRPFIFGMDVAPVYDEHGQVPAASEDYVFSLRAAELGFQPYCHTGVTGDHEFSALSRADGIYSA